MFGELKGRGFDVLTVNSGDPAGTIQKLWRDSRFALRSVMGGDHVSDLYKVTGIPTNYLVGSDGKILATFLGYDPEGIRAKLRKLGIK
jgi:hypothetical protein